MISAKHFVLCLPVMLLCAALYAQGGPQLSNMAFDQWHKSKGVWYPFAEGAAPIWDTGNAGLHKVGLSCATPEYEHVAVKGKGKAAARLESRKLAWAFIAGNLFNGRFIRLIDMKGVETELGAPFSGRPKTLKGYYHYIPKNINFSKEPYKNMEGKPDEALIEVILTDWDKPYRQISHIDGFIDPENDPHIIGIASTKIKKGTKGYVEFELPFTYRSGKTPKYAVFTISASRFGAWDTGASGSVLYVDEFSFTY